jgi:broad-specificity NMP kinase
MIIAIEGAPGVGKSATAAALAKGRAYVVPEVNRLFARPDPEPAEWYCERQIARWEMARLHTAQDGLAVLDGDPFQPL